MPTNNDWLEQGLLIIREAEEKLRGVLSKAAAEGDYDAIPRLNECAKRLSEIVEKPSDVRTSTHESNGRGSLPTKYPKFFRRDNKLVMVGWSKKGSTEYKHEAPRTVLDKLVSALASVCSNQESVPFKELPLLEDPETGVAFPQYYVRTFLRWLRTIGVIEKNGHQGYSIAKSINPESTINLHWRRLARLDG